MHDSHIHLGLEPLKSNIPEVIEKFLEAKGKYILTQGTDIVDFDDIFKLAKDYPGVIQIALGLHPTFFEEQILFNANEKEMSSTVEKLLNQFECIFFKNIKDIVAIGETGLDYYQIALDKSINKKKIEEVKEWQRFSFKRHLKLAKEQNLPLSIHARDIDNDGQCVKDVLSLIANEGKGSLTGSFHSYTGDISLVEDILNLGFYIGFNAIITYNSGENVREILKKVPLDRILFETDGPFLPPQSVRKNKKIKEKFAQPSDVREIMRVAAEIKKVDIELLEKVSDQSYEKIFLKN